MPSEYTTVLFSTDARVRCNVCGEYLPIAKSEDGKCLDLFVNGSCRCLLSQPIFVFDIDETLIHIDASACAKDGYSQIHFTGFTGLYRVFRALYDQGEQVLCLTNRDPSLADAYAKLLGIRPHEIMLRSFDTIAELGIEKLAELNQDPLWVKLFFNRMFLEKKNRLVELTKTHAAVFYFDDMKLTKHWPAELDRVKGLTCIPWSDTILQ